MFLCIIQAPAGGKDRHVTITTDHANQQNFFSVLRLISILSIMQKQEYLNSGYEKINYFPVVSVHFPSYQILCLLLLNYFINRKFNTLYYCNDEILLILTVTLHKAMFLSLHNYQKFHNNYIISVNTEEGSLIPLFSLFCR